MTPAASRPPHDVELLTPAERGTERLMLGLRLDRPLQLNGLAALVDDGGLRAARPPPGSLERDAETIALDRARPVPGQRRGRERAAMSRARRSRPASS